MLDDQDLETAFVRPAAAWGAAGTVLWGASADTANATLCGNGPAWTRAFRHSPSPFLVCTENPYRITHGGDE